MASFRTLIPSKSNYLKKDDFPTPRITTITGWCMEELKGDDGTEEKFCLTLAGYDKKLIVNLSNGEEIASAYGEDPDKWTGKQIEIYHDPNVKFGSKKVGGIRVRMPVGTYTNQAKAEKFSTVTAWTWDQAVLHAFQSGISKAELIACMKAEGRESYQMLRDTPLVQQIIEAKQAKLDTSGDDFAIASPPPDDGSVPF